jgi:hypothetical protein
MALRQRALIGQNHQFYALAAAILGGATFVVEFMQGLTWEQRGQGLVAFLMMYFAGAVHGLAYGSQETFGPHRLACIYWRFGKVPYFVAAAAGLIYLIVFDEQSSNLLLVATFPAVLCLVPSVYLRLRAQVRRGS